MKKVKEHPIKTIVFSLLAIVAAVSYMFDWETVNEKACALHKAVEVEGKMEIHCIKYEE